MGGVLDLFWEDFNHRPQVVAGVLEAECSCLLEEFSARCGKADKKAERTTSSPLLLFQLI